MEGHKPVFLAGLHRSGTTLLARLLASHPEVSGFSGTGVPADEATIALLAPPLRATGAPAAYLLP